MSKSSTLSRLHSSMAGASRSGAMAASDNGSFGADGHGQPDLKSRPKMCLNATARAVEE